MKSNVIRSLGKCFKGFLAGTVLLGATSLALGQQSQGGGGQSLGGTTGGSRAGGGGAGGGSFGSGQSQGAFGSGQSQGAFGSGQMSGSFGSGGSGGGGGITFLDSTLSAQSATTGRVGSSTGVQPSNLFAATYGNPFSAGIPGANGQITFGVPLYSTTGGVGGVGTQGRTSALGGNTLGGTARLGTGQLGANQLGTGANQLGSGMNTFQPPAYVTQLVDIPFPALPATQLQGNLQDVLARSTTVPSAGNVQVSVEGGAVVLRGTVQAPTEQAADRQRKLIQAKMEMRSGVRQVRNELGVEIQNNLPQPRPVP